MKEYGYFTENGYQITNRETPRHWYNYLYNDEYITNVSQVGFGQGFAQDDLGRRISLVTDRAVYVADESEFWQAGGLPVEKSVQKYDCLHAIGYTDINLVYRSIRTKCRYFVPNDGRREIIWVSVKNESKHTKTVKIIPYVATEIDGRYKMQGYETDYGDFSEEKNAAIATGFAAFGSEEKSRRFAYLTSSETATGYDTRNSAFIGVYGNKLFPKALLANRGCTNSDCIAEKLCLAIENTVTLAPSESKVFYYTIGIEDKIVDIPQFSALQHKELFAEMKDKYHNLCSTVTLHTPWDDLNNLFEDWLKYQTNMGSRWARVRHNGFRDMTSDTECLGCFQPELAADRLCRIMGYQYSSGYAPRTFIDGKIKDNNFADNAVWLVFAVYAITKELGSTDFLSRSVPFNNGDTATVYEHAKRAVSFLWKFTGHNGLIKIWGGDWNDCINKAGLQENGVSIWLSMAFVRAAKMLSQMANWLGNESDAKAAVYYAQEMQARIDRFGWDEDRYIYAVSDDKHPIGAKSCKEGNIHALPQLWSVLAELNPERTPVAMQTLEAELNTDLGLLVCKPPYTEQLPYLGSISCKYPGLHENGGVYLHAAMWKLAVDSILKNNEKIEEGLRKILPTHNEFYETCGEPYVMFNSYLGEQTGYRAGKPGQSWRTASGQWLLYALVRYIFGLQPEFGGILLNPCLPPSWKDCSISKLFRGCRYNFHFTQKDNGPCNTIESMYINGHSVNPKLPIKPQPGKSLDIEVVLRNIK